AYGRGGLLPAYTLTLQTGFSYDEHISRRHGDGVEAAHRFWERLFFPPLYRTRLERLGYRDPSLNEHGQIVEDDGSATPGLFGVPDPMRPGYVLTWDGIPVKVGSRLWVRDDKPFVTSDEFPGLVLIYTPLPQLQVLDWQKKNQLWLDEHYFDQLEWERAQE